MDWKQAVDYLASEVEAFQGKNWDRFDFPLVLNALTGWLHTSLTEDTEMAVSEYEAVSRRVVFLFDNDYTLTIGKGITPTIARLSEEIAVDLPLPFEGMLEENWEYMRAVNGWRRNENLSNEELANFLLTLSEELGESPTLILPFESKLDVLEHPSSWDKAQEHYHTWIKLLELFAGENQQKTVDTIGMSLIVCEDEEYMSEHCDYSRLSRLSNELYWDKCSELSQAKRDWSECFNESDHLPDGTLTAVVYDLNPEEERLLKKLASDFGLDAGPWQEGEFEARGDVWFGT
jgi:hypothetical protein